MFGRTKSAWLAAIVLVNAQLIGTPVLADNQMGYQLFSQDQAAGLERGGGSLGLKVGTGQPIDSGGMRFELLRVQGVRRGSAGDQAGFRTGDDLIAVDGRVFANIASFGAYVGSKRRGDQISVDYIPNGGGPQQAQRVSVALEGASAGDQRSAPAAPRGLSTGTKVAIGLGATALFGCYKFGCFSHRSSPVNPQRQLVPSSRP